MEQYLLQILLLIPAIIIGLSFHEFAHGLAADKLGDPTPRNSGRLTIEPWPHIDILGLIMIFIPPHFGWAKPIPIDPRNFKKPRRDEIIVSFAGPLANLLMAVLFGLILMLVVNFNVLSGSERGHQVLQQIIAYIIIVNINLFLFNLIPIPPLDGSHILENILPYNKAQKYIQWTQSYGFIILLILVISGAFSYILSPASEFIFYLILKLFGLA